MTTTAPPFETEDMTLVTVLKLRGIEPTEMTQSSGGCRWHYTHTRTVDEILDEYNAGECYTEPREFARKMGLVRQEMYRFLGVPRRSIRR